MHLNGWLVCYIACGSELNCVLALVAEAGRPQRTDTDDRMADRISRLAIRHDAPLNNCT